MERKRGRSEAESSGSKRLRTDENRDGHVRDVPDTDSDEEINCSQNPDFTAPGQNNEAESGVIEEITLQNFMCHSHLRVPFSSNVNFITGRNGSGKSAIMTAIVVGLGGKASNTNRGSSLKGFVKDKCNTAVIKIKLKNYGEDAFKPNDYGLHIIVERKISSDGAGSYKICNERGSLVSNKKTELDHILDHFNIQVDNPVSILNQDTSRNFLYASDPSKKYKLFLKATQLEETKNNYLTIQENLKMMSITLENKKEGIEEMKNEVIQLEQKYRDIQQLKVLEEKITDLKKEIAWAQVVEKEKKQKPLITDIAREKERLPQCDEKIQTCEASIAKNESTWGDVKLELDQISGESDQLTVRQESINKEVKAIRNNVRASQSELRKLERELQSTEKEKNVLEQQIQDICTNAMKDKEPERLERERQLQQKRESLQAMQFQLNATNNHKKQVENNVELLSNQNYQLRNEVNDARNNVEQSQRKLSSLREGQKDRLKRFGSKVPELLRRVETAVRRGRFHKPPKGPVGACITLREDIWAVAVETCLKGLAFAYCCHDFHDSTVLREVMKELFDQDRMPAIVISKFQDAFYDVSANKPRCRYPTVTDVLQIDDPVIFNCIVDQRGAECILLIKDPKEARDVMFNRPPTKAEVAFASTGEEIHGGASAKSYGYSGSGSSYLKGNIEDQIRRVQAQLDEETGRHNDLKSKQVKQEKDLKELQAELKKSRIKSMKEQEKYNNILQDITELEQFEEELAPDVTVLQEDVNTLTQQIEDMTSQNDNRTKDFLQAKKSLEEKTKESDANKAKIQEVIDKAEPLTLQLNSIEAEIAKAKGHLKYYRDKKNEITKKISAMEKDLKSLNEEAKDAAQKAEQYCGERLETTRSVESLAREIQQTERVLRAEQQSRGQVEEITRLFLEAKKRYDDVDATMKSLISLHKKLREILKERTQLYTEYRKHIALRANYHFQMMLSQRGYTGRIKFRHNEGELHLLVDVDQAGRSGTKSTKSLSGGERSFATVSFIMALWDAMEAPFRVLDEFDVFMDMVNRRITMDSIMKVAAEQQHRQFILLTPQDMSNIVQTNRIRIFKLQDPERGQTTLPVDWCT